MKFCQLPAYSCLSKFYFVDFAFILRYLFKFTPKCKYIIILAKYKYLLQIIIAFNL